MGAARHRVDSGVTAVTPLTPDEASAAADCVAAILDDYSLTLDFLAVVSWEQRGGDVADHAYTNEPATQARVAAARTALVKLREVAG